MTKVLITGGSGFLGRRLGLQLRHAGHEVILAARNHQRLLEAEAATGCPTMPLDVARIESVRDVFGEVRPAVVIHAAATKFVDLSEKYPCEAVDVNVIGSQNVARVAMDCGTEVVVGISTDKAAPPIKNTYGLSKALMERMFCSLDGKNGTAFVTVRYGNVAWSTGSVLPIWRQAIADGRPLRSTGPEMLRFFFTVDEAAELVLTAMDNIDELHGSVVARAMKAAAMGDILRVWQAQAPGIKVELIPVRPGERTVEYLLGEQELPYTHERIYNRVVHYIICFNHMHATPPAEVLTSANAVRLSDAEIAELIAKG